jgi:hypothetical protein
MTLPPHVHCVYRHIHYIHRLRAIFVKDSVQLLRHLHEIGAAAIHMRHEDIQLESEQVGLSERCMELYGLCGMI